MKLVLIITSVLLLPNSWLLAADTPAVKPMIGRLPVSKVLFLGNSITLHGPAPAIGWTGNWGMAASVKEKDYVHLLTADIAKATGTAPEIRVRNIADFERGYDAFDIEKEFREELEFQADIVILAIGENVAELATDDAKANYAKAFARLLPILGRQGQSTVFVRGCFWKNESKDAIMRKATTDANATFVDIKELGGDESNAARSERTIQHAGVAGHPGDKGMRAIADAIFAAIQKHSKPVTQ
ncbi:MAG: SGNH/GDSL hydrolase family protein [Schlesneria sp.]